MTTIAYTPPAPPALDEAEKRARRQELLGAEYARPDWGLPAAAGGTGTGGHRQELGVTDEATALAAVALVLARYDGLDRIVLAAARGGEGVCLAAFPAAGRTRVAALVGVAADHLARPWPRYDPRLAADLERADGGGQVTVAVRFERGSAAYEPDFPLTVTVSRAASGMLRSRWAYRRDVFDGGMVAQFARHVAYAARQLAAAAPGAELGAVELLGSEERRRVLSLGDPGRTVPDEPRRLDAMVAEQAASRPRAVAVSDGPYRLTYGQLDARANRIAHALRGYGVRPGSTVGVCLERSAELVAVLLGVLRAGAAYVPMEPGHPAERLRFTVADAAVAVVVTDRADFPGVRARVVRAERLRADAAWQRTAPPAGVGSAGDAAYVIYTSGSTGRPKGVAVSHRNVTALLAGTGQDFRFQTSDVWALFHSVAFDMSVWEIWGALTTGGRLVVVPHHTCREPRDLHALLTAERVTVLNQTPSAFAQLLEADRTEPRSPALRLVTFGGEPLDARMLLRWFDRHPEDRCRMVNLYGITETTVHSTWTTLTRAAAEAATRDVGPALPGEHLSVRDPDGRLLPPGVAGEIYVGGTGVALGYLNRPDLTAARFLADPDRGGRMYRSGDKGRLRPDGRLEHLGRLDGQVKLRGYRIELDEIRAVLLEDPHVLAAAVVVNRPGGPESARLDAYVVLEGGDPTAVRARAGRLLPEYMVPGTVTALPALPLTGNGKLDRSRLPHPGGPAPAAGPPTGDLSTAVRDIWRTLTGIDAGPDDNFFDTGGNSLLIGRLVKELQARGLPRLRLKQVYLNPTVRQLSALLARPN